MNGMVAPSAKSPTVRSTWPTWTPSSFAMMCACGYAVVMAAVVYLVSDLLFTSKIRQTAQQPGLDVQAVRSAAEVARATTHALVFIVDLRPPDALPALEAAAAVRF